MVVSLQGEKDDTSLHYVGDFGRKDIMFSHHSSQTGYNLAFSSLEYTLNNVKGSKLFCFSFGMFASKLVIRETSSYPAIQSMVGCSYSILLQTIKVFLVLVSLR